MCAVIFFRFLAHIFPNLWHKFACDLNQPSPRNEGQRLSLNLFFA